MFTFGTKRRIEELEEGLKRVTRDLQALELEWGNVYDKLRKAMGRIVKSRAIIEAKEPDQEPVPVAPQVVGRGHVGGLLTDRQRDIQQQILKRRAGGG